MCIRDSTNGGNLLSGVTQRGNTTSYGYSGAFNKMTGLKSEVTDPSGVKASYTYDGAGRPKSTSIQGGSFGSVSYEYTKSLLTKITRTASGKPDPDDLYQWCVYSVYL